MRTLFGLLLLVALATPLAAQRPADPALRRRAQLEAQLLQRFIQQASRELQLQPAEQARLTSIVQEVAAERRGLNNAAADLRRRLALAVRDPGTTDAQFDQLLEEQRLLRQREQQLWLREQERLQQVLSARERALFALRWLRLQDDARGLMMQRGVPPGPLPGR